MHTSCPLAGCRASEMAMGGMQKLVDRMLQKTASDVMLNLCPGLPPDEQTEVVCDYQRAKEQVCFTVSLKTAPWSRLPLHLLGIAHADEAVARQCVQECLQLMEAEPVDQPIHPLSAVILSPTSPVHAEALRFLQGEARERLPAFLQQCARLRFVLMNDRWVEGFHASVHRALAFRPHFSPPLVALEVQRTHIQELLSQDKTRSELEYTSNPPAMAMLWRWRLAKWRFFPKLVRKFSRA